MLTLYEVKLLGLPAVNHTRARRDEYGMDWEHWRYSPARDGLDEYLSDGHDYGPQGGWPPDEGWELVKPLTLNTKQVADLLHTLQELRTQVAEVACLPTKSRRNEKARQINGAILLLLHRLGGE